MPDITMCHGEKEGTACPERDQCYRYTAKPSEFMQAWFKVAPFNETGCDLLAPSPRRVNDPDVSQGIRKKRNRHAVIARQGKHD